LVVGAGIGEGQVVRRHVVSRVAQVREEAVADAQRLGGCAGGEEADGDGGGEQGRLPAAEGPVVRARAEGERHASPLPARACATAATRARPTRKGWSGGAFFQEGAFTGEDPPWTRLQEAGA